MGNLLPIPCFGGKKSTAHTNYDEERLLNLLKQYLQKCTEENEGKEGISLISAAEIKELLIYNILQKNINLNYSYKNGKTLLMYIAENINSSRINKRIIELQQSRIRKSEMTIQVNTRDKDEQTALMYAIKSQNNKLISTLHLMQAEYNQNDFELQIKEGLLHPRGATIDQIELLYPNINTSNLRMVHFDKEVTVIYYETDLRTATPVPKKARRSK